MRLTARRLLFSIITVQVFVIAVIIYDLYKKQASPGVVVNPVGVDNFEFKPSETLSWYYDPLPNTLEVVYSPPGISYTPQNVSNSDGLNEVRDYEHQKENGIYRIITLGDSFTYGLYVPTKENWTEILERKLNEEARCDNITDYEVINFGVSAYDNEYSVERFKRKGIKYRPDLILWLQVEPKRINELIMPKVARYRDELQKSAVENKGFEEGKYRNIIYQEILSLYGDEKIFEYQEKVIEKLGYYFTNPVVLIPIPGLTIEEKEMIRSVVLKKGNWHYFDGLRRFSVFKNDGHPDKKGHGMIAEDIYDFLVSGNIMRCTK